MQENAVAARFKRGYTRKAQAEFQCVYTFKEIRNYQAQQQAVFLALLNRVYDVAVQQQVKRSLVTLPFFRVEELRAADDVVRVNDFVEARCRERFVFETRQGVSEKTAQRRCETYKVTENLHALMDILMEFGYFFEARLTTGKRGTTKTETVYKVFAGETLLLRQRDIEERGSRINRLIAEQTAHGPSFVFLRNDAGLAEALGLN